MVEVVESVSCESISPQMMPPLGIGANHDIIVVKFTVSS